MDNNKLIKGNGLVSVVLPVHNGETYLREAIESILKQTYRKLELIVVNDYSTDNSRQIVEEFITQDPRVTLINNEKNLRLPASLNVGFAASKGDYLTWTSDDNILFPQMLQRMIDEIDKGYDFVYADTEYIDSDGNKLKIKSNRTGSIWKQNVVGACFLYTRNVYEQIGDYDTTAFLVEDYDYWIRVSLSYSMQYINEVLYLYRVHESSLSGSRKQDVLVATVKQLKKYLAMDGMDETDRNIIREQLAHYYYQLKQQKALTEELQFIKKHNEEQYNKIPKKIRLNQYLSKSLIDKLVYIKHLFE